jgi:transcriptional regulator with XRE-family HTH domain
MKFNDRLKELREYADLTQEELANKIGVSRYTILRYESGKIEPNLDKVIALAKLFDISIDYLLGYSDNKKSIDSKYTVVIKEAELSNLKPSDLEDLIKMIRRFQKHSS